MIQCACRARIEDIRTIYADKLIAADDSQLESMQLQVLDAQSAKMNAEAVVKQIRRRMHKTSKQARFMRVWQGACPCFDRICGVNVHKPSQAHNISKYTLSIFSVLIAQLYKMHV